MLPSKTVLTFLRNAIFGIQWKTLWEISLQDIRTSLNIIL
jgi:ubiquinone biosynthesis protein Coq4